MMKWITANPLYAGIAGVAIVLVIILAFRHFERKEIRHEEVLVNSGVTQERAATQSEVLNNVEAAKDAVAAPTANEQQRVCEKYDRACQSGQ